MKVMPVFGTRPEAIKMCPLVKELMADGSFEVSVCVTGQHRELLDDVLGVFGIVPDYDLGIMRRGQTLSDVTCGVLSGMERVLTQASPELVLVHGDTTTALAAALAAYYRRIPVGHVEAGLRTGDIYAPYPEEVNRAAIGTIASLHFAPTEGAAENLLREGKQRSRVFVTGNTVIDALRTTVRADYSHALLDRAAGRRIVLVTAHRRENLGAPMVRIFSAIAELARAREDIFVIFPVHPNPEIRRLTGSMLADIPNVALTEPLSVPDFHNFLARSALVLTDSGGAQEEAPFFGVPVLVMRDTTERPEGILAGTALLVGTQRQTILEESLRLLSDPAAYADMARAKNPYGDGFASRKICEILKNTRFLGKMLQKNRG